MSESTKTIYDSHQAEHLRARLQEEVNAHSYSAMEATERRKELYTKDEAERENLKKMKSAIKGLRS